MRCPHKRKREREREKEKALKVREKRIIIYTYLAVWLLGYVYSKYPHYLLHIHVQYKSTK